MCKDYVYVYFSLDQELDLHVSPGRTGSRSRTCHSCNTSLVHVAPATSLPVMWGSLSGAHESTGVLADLEKSDLQT